MVIKDFDPENNKNSDRIFGWFYLTPKEEAILRTIGRKPRKLQEIHKIILKILSVDLKPGSIYPSAHKLQELGLAQKEKEGAATIYTITAKGKAFLRQKDRQSQLLTESEP